jgi:hypothetical protein
VVEKGKPKMEFFSHSASDFNHGVRLHRLPMVYAIHTPNFEYTKIGISRSFKQRFSNIQSSCPFKLTLWLSIMSPKASVIEDVLHANFSEWNVRGEWFAFTNQALNDVYSFFELTNKNVREVSRALL